MADDLTRFLTQVRSDPDVERTARMILLKYRATLQNEESLTRQTDGIVLLHDEPESVVRLTV